MARVRSGTRHKESKPTLHEGRVGGDSKIWRAFDKARKEIKERGERREREDADGERGMGGLERDDQNVHERYKKNTQRADTRIETRGSGIARRAVSTS